MDKRLKKMTAIFFLAAAADLFLAAVLLVSLARQRAEGAAAPGAGRVVEDGGWSGSWDGPGPEEAGAVALTFDDGPNARYTEALLDGLKEREVRASFFLVGQCIEGNEDTVRRMAEEGHLIGVHCMEHRDLTREPEEEAVRQLMDTAAMIGAVTGRMPEYIRPPFGKWSSGLQEAVPMETVLWSVDSLDWKLQDTDRIVRRVLKDTEDGDIILMHDEFQTSVEAAMEIIDNLLAKGYTFVTVDELTID